MHPSVLLPRARPGAAAAECVCQLRRSGPLAHAKAREACHLDLLTRARRNLLDELFDRLVRVLHEGLREQRALLEELLEPALDDLLRDVLRLALLLHLLEEDLA